MTPKYIYAGPSWAVSSFPSEMHDSTNLAKEWNLPYVNTAYFGSSVTGQILLIKKILSKHELPIIWVYNEPLADLHLLDSSVDHFVVSDFWQQTAKDCNIECLKLINSLNVPVLLIGGHRDIIDCDFPNIVVGCTSWQKFLAQKSGMYTDKNIIQVSPVDGANYTLTHCWGAEIIHKFLHQHADISPHPDLLDSIWDIYYFWDELQRRNWFFEVHPNKRGNTEFAKFLKPTVDKFLEENSNG